MLNKKKKNKDIPIYNSTTVEPNWRCNWKSYLMNISMNISVNRKGAQLHKDGPSSIAFSLPSTALSLSHSSLIRQKIIYSILIGWINTIIFLFLFHSDVYPILKFCSSSIQEHYSNSWKVFFFFLDFEFS